MKLLEPSCNSKGRILKLPRKTKDPRNGATHKKHGQTLGPVSILYVLNQTIPKARLTHGHHQGSQGSNWTSGESKDIFYFAGANMNWISWHLQPKGSGWKQQATAASQKSERQKEWGVFYKWLRI